MILDLHIHSIYSKDSYLSPAIIRKIGLKKGLNGLAVTDHNTIKGGVEVMKLNDSSDFFVIIGSEIKTEYGDIIGLFLNEEIKSRTFIQAAEEIKDQGGYVVLAHPFRKKVNIPSELFEYVDFVETFNARSPKRMNDRALELAKKVNKPMTAGSDAHLGFEIGRGRTITGNDITDSFRRNLLEIEGEESNYYFVHGLSVMIEKIKRMM